MIPLFSIEQIRNADKYAIHELKIPGIVLMENASLSIYNSIIRNCDSLNNTSNIGIVAGKGNNGGDAFAVARHFINNGFNVTVIIVAKKNDIKGDAKINFDVLNELSKNINNCNLVFYKSKNDLNKIKYSNIIIDGLLGTGTKGELKEPYKTIIEHLNNIDAYKVAIDLPSGLNVETSTTTTAFNADLTVTLADFKSGLFYGKGYEHSGKIEKGSIGIGKEYFENQKISEYLIEPEDVFAGLPKKKKASHKYSNGKALVIAGSGEYPGAASLVTKTLFQVGTGSVILAFPKSIKELVASDIGEAVFATYTTGECDYFTSTDIVDINEKLEWSEIIAIGTGLGRAPKTIEAIEKIIKKYKNKKMVIDADAIYAIGKIGVEKFNLKSKILTPHHAEFANLLNIKIEELKSNLLKFGKEFVSKTKSILVLKGAPTIIFLPNGDAIINSSGNVGMAKFGSGDVLTGVIAGLLSSTNNIENAVITGVYLHSLAADLLLEKETEFGITATKIEENLPNAIRFLRHSII